MQRRGPDCSHKDKNKKPTPHTHVNGFVNLNGVPYLLAEYLDRRNFMQLDRSLIRSEIFIDTSEAMRAIIDVNIDDIGRRASDGSLAVAGNVNKTNALLTDTANMAERLNHQFDVLRNGIIMRVNYQLENSRTGNVIRSMVEDLRINDRMYFVDVNTRDINDNAIVVNFSNSLISTINEFTHGRDLMVLRITSIQMFYECMKRDPRTARIRQATPELDYYNYHEQLQNHHIMGSNGAKYEGVVGRKPDYTLPPTWSMFSRYYHFDHDGHDIVLHKSEIEDNHAYTVLVPCGTVHVDRSVMINPGHRIIFKFSVWKNDVIVVSDCLPVAQAIGTPYLNKYIEIPYAGYHPKYDDDEEEEYSRPMKHHCHHDDRDYDHHFHREKHKMHKHETVLTPNEANLYKALQDTKKVNEQQTDLINKMAVAINALKNIISSEHEGVELPDDIETILKDCHKHERPKTPIERLKELEEALKNLSVGEKHDEINDKIGELQQQIENLMKVDEEIITRHDEDISSIPQVIPEDRLQELIDKIQNS